LRAAFSLLGERPTPEFVALECLALWIEPCFFNVLEADRNYLQAAAVLNLSNRHGRNCILVCELLFESCTRNSVKTHAQGFYFSVNGMD
jgi:hypothetical protein